MADRITFTSPAGRMVGGDVYKGNTTDAQGNPLVYKSGANIGQPKTNFYIGLAVAKNHQYMINQQTGLELTPAEIQGGIQGIPMVYNSWEETPWGQLIMQVALTGVPNAFDPATGQVFQGRSFAFKVTDGDSQTPNQNNKHPCDQEGYQGNWILNFSNGFAPKVCNKDGSAYITEEGAVKRGYYIQVLCNIGANNDTRNPGVYLNHDLVALAGYGEEIHSGVDASQAGFGGGALPAGASATPLGGMNQQQQAMGQQNGQVNAGQTINQQQANQVAMGQQNAPVNTQTTLGSGNVAPPPPATDLIEQQAPPQLEAQYIYNGQQYLESALLAMSGWTPAHLAGLQKV